MKFKRPSKLQIFAFSIFGFVAVRLIFFRAPSEAQMVTRLQEHKAEFEQLRSMLQQDKELGAVSHNWIDGRHLHLPEKPEQIGISEQRWAEYCVLMKKLGLSNCIKEQGKQEIFRFKVFGGGAVDTSWSIGYAWSQGKPLPLVKSAYHQMPRGDSIHFSHIEGNWYIYHLH